ncbi:DUF4351 domain-containing protein [uncultured Thiodictyon sp.]|uniref:DUF4351 domain-containing protein n=1 Tax=uncultured Thiodictyon sp. TaxID=1846217 RepID=UPI0025D05AE7|nr:DUF4351 domain-containing protein [uncultured Thiodictyon sp.]
MQTFIDRYIEQGSQLGVALGVEQGKQQGEVAVLLRQMDRKFGPLSQSVRERVVNADPEILLRWSDRILTAESLEAVFR